MLINIYMDQLCINRKQIFPFSGLSHVKSRSQNQNNIRLLDCNVHITVAIASEEPYKIRISMIHRI